MALLRKLLYKKPHDGLVHVFERIYVFDSCFRLETWDQEAYKAYVSNVISQFQESNPDSSVMIFNFREGDSASKIQNVLSQYYIAIMDYPKHYEGCPLLPMEVIHRFLNASESWLSLGQQNILLMHSELGGWPVLAFLLAALLLYRKHCTEENRALEMVHKQAPKSDLLSKMSPLDPSASQLRRPNVQSYNQAENELVKININCNIQGDIVLECINLDDDMVKQTIMYRVMFNTAFIKSHTLMFNRDEIDVYWDKKNQFPKDFQAVVLLSSCSQSQDSIFCRINEING
ncbi:hypothetical protein L1887_12087 [Cichorium endivia]|nr:hypothetical protein L1887_12087 [Cichorium endivia]